MDSHKVSDWISRQDKIDAWAKPTQEWLADIFQKEDGATTRFGDFLHGKWLSHPLHPIMVHVPIGCWTAAAILDLCSSSVSARIASAWAIGIGLLIAVPAILTGLADWSPYRDTAIRRIGFVHMSANVLAVCFYLVSDIVRAGVGIFWPLFFGYLGFACLLVSGYLGGVMVYEKRVGVNHGFENSDASGEDEFETVARLDELEPNRPTKVRVGDTYAVLVRTADRVYALAEKCSHEGGPLSQGHIEDGCILCPLHYTRFRLETGEIVSGPGVFSQPVFEVYIRDGDVRVKPSRVGDPFIAPAPVAANATLI